MCPNSPDGLHDVSQEPRTESDGTVRVVVYCRKCGMEW
jgi:hypothetical protein